MNARRSLLRALAAMLLLALALPALADAAKRKPVKLKVMTRNIYVGADISKPLVAPDLATFRQRNTEVWQMVQLTDFPARAKLLANELRRTKPDVIGLQEVATWLKSPDGSSDGQQTPATIVVYDFLKLLLKETKARGLRYRIGSAQLEADVEGSTTLGFDGRLRSRNVVLVRRKKGLKIGSRARGDFKTRIELTTPEGPVVISRGWSSVDGSYKGRRFRFINTHLEAFLDDTRLKQAQELVAKGGPTRAKRPVILAGDVNSDPNDAASADPAAYNAITGAGLRDAWITIRGRNDPGYACCMNQENIMDPPPAPFDHRIDDIFTRPRIGGTRAVIVGGDVSNRTASGLWPSDHGGWMATLRLR